MVNRGNGVEEWCGGEEKRRRERDEKEGKKSRRALSPTDKGWGRGGEEKGMRRRVERDEEDSVSAPQTGSRTETVGLVPGGLDHQILDDLHRPEERVQLL